MSFFVAKNETEMDEAMDAEALMRQHPDYYGPRFQAIADLRAVDDGSLHRGNGFRRVASFVNVPLFKAAMNLFDPEFMKDKRKFYAFLDRNREYCTYDRRNGGRPTAKDNLKLPLSALGLDYPGHVEDFEPVLASGEPEPEPQPQPTPDPAPEMA